MYLGISKFNKDFNFDNYKMVLPLKKLNILIGANNSGKSYYLRSLMKSLISINNIDYFVNVLDDLFDNHFNISKFDFNTIKLYFSDITDEEVELLNDYQNVSRKIKGNVISDTSTTYLGGRGRSHPLVFKNELETKREIELIQSINKKIFDVDEILIKKNKVEIFYDEIKPKFEEDIDLFIKTTLKDYFINKIEENEEYIINIKKLFELDDRLFTESKENDQQMLFIPTIRSLRHPLKVETAKYDYNENNIFKNRVIEEYDIDTEVVDIFTGLDFYHKYKTKLLGSNKDRLNISEFEKIVSKIFFKGKQIVIIPNESTHELTISISNEDDKELYKVGDGIGQIILILYALIVEDRKYIFIEEPELSLHPGYQKLLSKILSSYDMFENKIIFITTHSNHIIDRNIGFDDNKQILKVTKVNDNLFNINKITNNDISILNNLGVSPSSVFLSNKSIFVEGKYDALYIRHLLEYENVIEGLDYVFVPYGGSNRTLFEHQDEVHEIKDLDNSIMNIKNISKDYIFIMDDDGIDESTKNKENNRNLNFYDEIKNSLADNLYKLSAYEIENIVSEITLIDYIVNKTDESNRTEIEKYVNNNAYFNVKLTKYFEDLENSLNIKLSRQTIDKELMYKLFTNEGSSNYSNSAIELQNRVVSFLSKD